ncbi:XRE family transcriptional regulator [Rhizobium leguminosarum]|uniref:helix-turn-helix domain-containing protein n=1 Tax=Rhizobium leguminosarum TaxID=384 RepID=UPI001030C2F6|nr:helix-turn-helix transcriptional regulator [Rhizobium leguminosarum]TBE73858.1 XRE family transcriptional regulator [Rhizobium leguminosarum]
MTTAMTMDPAFFVTWRKRHNKTNKDIAELLDVHEQTVKSWNSGKRKIPPYMGLLMAAIDAGLEPVGKDHMIPVEAVQSVTKAPEARP